MRVLGFICAGALLTGCLVTNPDYTPGGPDRSQVDRVSPGRDAGAEPAVPDGRYALDQGREPQRPDLPASDEAGLTCNVGETVHDGHCYRVLQQVTAQPGVTQPYASARQLCITEGGAPVSITSAAEQSFVFGLLTQAAPSSQAAWIGLRRVGPGKHDFAWESGEPFSYSDWAPGEPSNSDGGEDCGVIWGPALAAKGLPGRWNDAPCSYGRDTIICERLP